MIKPFIDQSQDVRIGGIAGKLYHHINDDTVHLTEEEKKFLQTLQSGDPDSGEGDISSQIDDIYVQLGNKADKEEIPTKVSQLENDMNYLTEIPDYYTTEEEVKLLIQTYVAEGDFDVDLDELQKQIKQLTDLVNTHELTLGDIETSLNQLQQSQNNLNVSVNAAIDQLTGQLDILSQKVDNVQLKPATGTVLGGIKVGAGLNVEEDGTLSVSSSSGGGGGGSIDRAELDKYYLRKDTDDSTKHSLEIGDTLTSDTIRSSEMYRGQHGSGFFLGMDDGNSVLEVDDLLVRNRGLFEELEIRKTSYVNGSLVLSAAGSIIESVEQQTSGDWKCYLKSDNGDVAVTNSFETNDLVRCQTFDVKPGIYENVSNKFYWRQVISTGTEGTKNYIVLSKTQKSSDTADDESGTPASGDTIVQFGNTSESSRQNVIVISSVDTDAPSITMYTNVQTFNLSQATISSKISPSEVRFNSDLFKLVSGGNVYNVAIDRGQWNTSTTYYHWDRVSHNGNLWLCMYQNPEGCTGIEPGGSSSSSYWMLQVSKGDPGSATDKPQLIFNEPIVVTAYDGVNYSPDITGKTITVSLQNAAGESLNWSNVTYIAATCTDGSVQVTADGQTITIQECTLQVGESVRIDVTADVKETPESETTITITNSISVVCIQQPETEYTVQAYVSPSLRTDNYSIKFGGDNLIQSISWPASSQIYTYDLYLFVGSKMVQWADITNTQSGTLANPGVMGGIYANGLTTYIPLQESRNGTASITVSQDRIRYGNVLIPSNIKSPQYVGNNYYPVSNYNIRFDIYADDWNIRASADLTLNIFSQSSIFENTTTQLKSVKTSIADAEKGISANTSLINQTAEAIRTEVDEKVETINGNITKIEENVSSVTQTAESLTKFVGKYLNEEGTTLESVIEQTAGDIDMSVIYNNLRMAGLNISVDEGQETGSVTIYGDKVTIKNSEDSNDDVLYVQGGQTYLGNTNIVSGKIGGFNISSNAIGTNTNSTGDGMYMDRKYIRFNERGLISSNVYNLEFGVLNIAGVDQCMLIQATSSSSEVMPLYGIHTTFTRNENQSAFALFGDGIISVEGPIVETSAHYHSIPTNTIYYYSAPEKGTTVVLNTEGTGAYFAFPTLSQLRSSLGISSTTECFVIPFKIMNISGRAMTVCGKGSSKVSSTYSSGGPTLRNSNGDVDDENALSGYTVAVYYLMFRSYNESGSGTQRQEYIAFRLT